MKTGSVGLRLNPLINKHVGIAIPLFIASEALVLEIVVDVPLRNPAIVELQPPLSHFDEGIVMSALRTA